MEISSTSPFRRPEITYYKIERMEKTVMYDLRLRREEFYSGYRPPFPIRPPFCGALAVFLACAPPNFVFRRSVLALGVFAIVGIMRLWLPFGVVREIFDINAFLFLRKAHAPSEFFGALVIAILSLSKFSPSFAPCDVSLSMSPSSKLLAVPPSRKCSPNVSSKH